MGESVVKAPDVQNKMGGSVSPHGALEVSISFGRFDNDSLSWEKWSTFSPNKYLEEVEKCSTPGSVAQKKAYFEAHYKKIAARKAELLEQENMMTTDSSRSNEMNGTDYSTSTSGTDAERGILNGQSFAEDVELDADSLSDVSSSIAKEPAEADEKVECQNSLFESAAEEVSEKLLAAEEVNEKLQSKEVNYPEIAYLVTEEILKISEEVQHIDEKPVKVGTETISMVKGQEEKSKFNAQNTAQKASQIKKEQNSDVLMKKKPVLPTTKSSGLSTPKNPTLSKSVLISTPRLSKPVLTSTLKSSKPVLTSTPKSSKPVLISTLKSSKPVLTSTPRSSKPVSTSTPSSSKPVSISTPRSSKPVSTSTPRLSKPRSTATPSPGLSKPVSTSGPTLSKSVPASATKLSRPASASASRLSKPISTPVVRPVSQSSTRKPNVSPSRRSKNSSMTEIKLAVPTSLHKSLDNVSFPSTRKPLIMEQMGDKDIVKRAFKSFQNNSNQSQPSRVEKPCGSRPMSARGSSEHQVSSSVTSLKENERTRKATEKMNAQRIHVGTEWSTTSSRSLVETGAGIYMKPDLSSPGPISEERAEKRKAFFKNLEEKSYAREEEKRRLGSKPKETAENNIGYRPE